MKIKDAISHRHAANDGGPARLPRPRRRYRVDIIDDNTLTRLGGLRLSGLRAILAGAGILAAIASLILVILLFTPAGYLLPGSLRPGERWQYADLLQRVDSLQSVLDVQRVYTRNIRDILTDSVAPATVPAAVAQTLPVDSLMQASEAERQFVRNMEHEQRYNLSVLTPIAAEGMLFENPLAGLPGVGAVYRGTVIAADDKTVIIQHPADFISVYGDLAQIYVEPGQKITAGQRIGQTDRAVPLFELWHSGSRLDPGQYIAMPAKDKI